MLKALGDLGAALRQLRDTLQHVCPIGVHPEVLEVLALLQPFALVHAPQVGNHTPREQQRFVRLLREHHLRAVRVLQVLPLVVCREGLHQRGYLCLYRAVHLLKAVQQRPYLFRLHERLIALYIDYHRVTLVLLAEG